MEKNRQLYSQTEVVKKYCRLTRLSPPEQTILEIIKTFAPEKNMLDVGVGTGRTTPFFAPLFSAYTGLDYSQAMISACYKRFGSSLHAQFIVGDARNMHFFADRSFDFVLFSFNGIDCIPSMERDAVFSEIHRVGRENSLFAFSSHNYYYLPRLFSFQYPRNPMKYPGELCRYKQVLRNNPPLSELLKMEYAPVHDEYYNFGAENIYCKPEVQIMDLKKTGFANIRVFSLKSGREFSKGTDWKQHDDEWLYYLAQNLSRS